MALFRYRGVCAQQHSRFFPRRSAVLGSALVCFASCSLTDLSVLNRGGGSGGEAGISGDTGQGGIDQGGTASGGTSTLAGAAGGVAGGINKGGAAGTSTTAKAGTGNIVGSAGASGGAIKPSGGAAAGGAVGIAGAMSCPAFVGTGGVLMTPPSNGFEGDISSWSTTGSHNSAISQLKGGVSPCDGTAYLVCAGVLRSGGGWDGPAIDIISNVVEGREYTVTMAARFDPAAGIATAKSLRLVVAKFCADSSIGTEYTRVAEGRSSGDWARLTGIVRASLAGCTSLRKVQIYLETDDLDVAFSLHADDFRMYDMTAISGVGGASGVAGATGTGHAGAAGVAGGPAVVGGTASAGKSG